MFSISVTRSITYRFRTALALRSYSLKQTVVHGQKKGTGDEAIEEGGIAGEGQADDDAAVGKQTTPGESAAITPQGSRVDEKTG